MKKWEKSIITIFCLMFVLVGCSMQVVQTTKNKEEVESVDVQASFYPKVMFLRNYMEVFGDYNNLAKKIYDGINRRSNETFTDTFVSYADAEHFQDLFNQKMFNTFDFTVDNGIILTDYQSNGVASFVINESTYNNIENYEKFVWLAQALYEVPTENLQITNARYVQKVNNWIVENVDYDVENKTPNVSIDIFTGMARAEAIANAVKILCEINGIGCEIVTGSANGAPATWNKIYNQDGASYIDTSLNCYYKSPTLYFLSTEIWEDHIINE